MKLMKNIFVHTRTTIKLLVIIILGILIIGGLVTFVYRPIYSVTLNGEFVGYVQNKNRFEKRIKEYMQNGEGENVAFVDIGTLPEYTTCLLKKDKVANEDEIFEKVKATGTVYYKYYTVTVGNEEKAYVATKEEAEDIITQLKKKNSSNKSKLSYSEKCETEVKEFKEVATAVDELYVKPVETVARANTTGTMSASKGMNSGTGVNIGITLIRPTSGTVTSRFGPRSSGVHKGLDIANPKGTAIYAAASGTVSFTGWMNGYGNLVIISHGNGIQTYYAHCSELNVSAGQHVSQGQKIAESGSTGNSSGNHLHLEVRANGVAQNPQTYVY